MTNQEIISDLEKIPNSSWEIYGRTPTMIYRATISTMYNGNKVRLTYENEDSGYDIFIENENILIEDINSDILKNTFIEIISKLPFYKGYKERIIEFEKNKIKQFTNEIKSKLFRADYKYCERSWKYKKGEWINNEYVYAKYGTWEYKEHKYHDIEYFNTLKVGDKGFVLREYDKKRSDRFTLYDCEIILKDETDKIIIYKVSNMKHCKNSVIDTI